MYDEPDTGLVGRTITAVNVTTDILRFETDLGPVVYRVEGDCCSHSYFYDFVGIGGLIGSKVTELRPVPLADLDDDDSHRGDSVQGYGFEVHYHDVNHYPEGPGVARFSFRNDSNGYYGGWMERVTNP